MKQFNVRKAVMLICLFGIVVCLLVFIPQTRPIIIKLAGQLNLGRLLPNYQGVYRYKVLILLAIYSFVFLTVMIFLNYKYKINYSKHFFQMTSGSLYSGETEISEIKTDKTITSTLVNKFKKNSWLIFSICIVFLIILVFYTAAHPIVPYDGDDWLTLSSFRYPVPLASSASHIPARILPFFLGPLAGLFAAHIVYPVLGDYLISISFTVALTMAGFTTIFYLSLYRLFLTLSGSKMVSILSGLIIICLYFGLFKTRTVSSQYMLYANGIAAYFAYTIPHLLNSICVCLLMHYAVCGKHISSKGLGGKTFSIFTMALYFAIFSLLFSVIILAVYCFWKLLISAIHREKLTKNLILIVILAGFFVYASIEFIGDRAETIKRSANYSLFSLEHLRHCKVTFMNFLGLIRQIDKTLLFLTVSVNILAMILFGFNMANDKNKPLVKTGIISLLGFVSLVPAIVIIAGTIGYDHAGGGLMFMYGVFFYYILFSAISLVYMVTKFKKQFVLSFFLLFIFLVATNTSKPYSNQADYNQHYFGHRMTTRQKIDLTNNWIEQMKIADKNRAESVIISIPETSNPRPDVWPVNTRVFSNALYAHGIISRKIEIIFQQDREMLNKF